MSLYTMDFYSMICRTNVKEGKTTQIQNKVYK